MFHLMINKYTIKLEFYKMRIDTLLNETQFLPSTDTISFSDLTPIQINVLKRLDTRNLNDDDNDNEIPFDYETATPRERLAIDELEDLGLVVAGSISPAGEKMVDVANSSGNSAYAKEAGVRDKLNKRSNIGGRRTADTDITSRADPLNTGDAQPLRF